MPQVREPLDVGLDVARDAAHDQVPLEPDAVDRDAAAPGSPGPSRRRRRSSRCVRRFVVVVAELGVGVGGTRGPERLLDVVVADDALEDRVAPVARPVQERLVDDVPGGELAAVVAGDVGDMVPHHLQQLGARGDALHPAGQLAVPDERVPPHLHAPRPGVPDELVGGGVVERVAGRLGRLPLHLVLGRELVELAVERLDVRRFAHVALGGGGAEDAAGGGRRVLQGARGGGGGRAGHQQGQEQRRRSEHRDERSSHGLVPPWGWGLLIPACARRGPPACRGRVPRGRRGERRRAGR